MGEKIGIGDQSSVRSTSRGELTGGRKRRRRKEETLPSVWGKNPEGNNIFTWWPRHGNKGKDRKGGKGTAEERAIRTEAKF